GGDDVGGLEARFFACSMYHGLAEVVDLPSLHIGLFGVALGSNHEDEHDFVVGVVLVVVDGDDVASAGSGVLDQFLRSFQDSGVAHSGHSRVTSVWMPMLWITRAASSQSVRFEK